MRKTLSRLVPVAVCTMAGAAVVVSGGADAAATPSVGTCTSSYAPYTYAQLGFDPDAQAIFVTIDTNRDGVICFKSYPNGPHHGHDGNLVDDKAAPHT
jgi:hypothetical protein